MNGEKESIIIKLKENGCRITKQRKMILDIILEDRCSSCKEIYARAVQQQPVEGMAKLSSIFASVIEPITSDGSGK